MPRNKVLMKKHAAAGGGRGVTGKNKTNRINKPKIVIKPFVKPPTLPPNFYDQTTKQLLQGTLDCVFSSSSKDGSSSSSSSLSLQNAYQQVVNLVSHQYGPRLYIDLIQTMQCACENFVLPDDDEVVQLAKSFRSTATASAASAAASASSAESDAMTTTRNNPIYSTSDTSVAAASEAQDLLSKIQNKYQLYVDYLLLCKHIFLPLDSSHVYNPSTQQVIPIGGTSGASGGSSSSMNVASASASVASASTNAPASTSASTTSSTAPATMMGLWQVGLEQFKKRLLEFHLDDITYQKWWQSLQIDWNDDDDSDLMKDSMGGVGINTTSVSAGSAATATPTVTRLPLEHQTLLQETLYMWQDLNMLSDTLATRLEPDLISFLKAKSEMIKTASSSSMYDAATVISYCYTKWMHVAYRWNRYLPKATCLYLLEHYMFKPHLKPEWLLNQSNFDSILEDAFTSSSSSSSTSPSSSSTGARMGGSSSVMVPTTSPIQQLWMLSGRLPGGHKKVGEAIARYARNRGMALMTSMATESNKVANKQKIGQLLELQGNLQSLLSQLPQGQEHCLLKPVWEDVVNPSIDDDHQAGINLVADALAKYVDSCLRDNKRQIQPSTTMSVMGGNATSTGDNWAEAIITGIFSFLQAKDIFEGFYKKDLAKRLLGNRVVSMDVERQFVSLLKAECGAGYTSKMEGMFQDMDWSRETTSRYKESKYNEAGYSSEKLEMDIQVLTTGYWPVYPQYPNLILPDEMKAPQEHFTEYYKSKYQGRRITWQYAIGQAVVRFKPRESAPKYELLVSPTQALVLMQFNSNDEMTLPQIMAAVGLGDRSDTELILLGLSLGKDGTRVLQKIDHDADKKKKPRPNVHDDDKFRVQEAFKSNARRIKINNILMKETKEERDKTVQSVSRDRLYYIDAVLVRIMKARKTVLHQQLIPQVLEQIKFPAQPADVKKRIEVLIEREYMERDAEDRNRYVYLA